MEVAQGTIMILTGQEAGKHLQFITALSPQFMGPIHPYTDHNPPFMGLANPTVGIHSMEGDHQVVIFRPIMVKEVDTCTGPCPGDPPVVTLRPINIRERNPRDITRENRRVDLIVAILRQIMATLDM